MWHFFREDDLSRRPFWTRVYAYPVRVAVRAYEEFFNDKCFQRASALAFASLLALVPVTAIFFFFLTRLEAFSEIQIKVEDLLFENLDPTRTEVIREYIKQYTQNVTLLGVFGITVLFITAIFLFNTIEHTINEIWNAKQSRPFLSKFSAFWTVLTATPVLVFVSYYVAVKLAVGNIDVFALKLFPYLLNWVAFWFAYQFIPYTHVRLRAAVIGAIVGGSLWELGKGGFNWYIGNMTSFDKIYGSLGAFPVFLLWLYITWLIVLFGAEVAYAVQHPQGKSHLPHEDLSDYLDFFAVRAMAEIVKQFNEAATEKARTLDHLEEIGIPTDVLGKILNCLAEKKLIIYTEDKDYVPARQPSDITVREVIEAVSGKRMLSPKGTNDPVSTGLAEAFREVGASVDSTLDGLSLQQLLERSEN